MDFPSRFGNGRVVDEPIYKSQGNDGKVKINGSGGIQPSYSLLADTEQIIDYPATPLNLSPSPTTQFPQNILVPSDLNVWLAGTKTFLENTVLGQKTEWRFIFDWSGKSMQAVVEVQVILRNTLSGFETKSIVVLPEGQTSGSNYSALLLTIADGNSLPAPFGTGQGYQLIFKSSTALNIVIVSSTRTSHQHNVR